MREETRAERRGQRTRGKDTSFGERWCWGPSPGGGSEAGGRGQDGAAVGSPRETPGSSRHTTRLEQQTVGSGLERRQVTPGEDGERTECGGVDVKMEMKNWFSGRDRKPVIFFFFFKLCSVTGKSGSSASIMDV